MPFFLESDFPKITYPEEHCVYYGQEVKRDNGDNRIVIGQSKNGPYDRLETYKCGSPIVLRAWEPGDRCLENRRHKEFGSARVHGTNEWFFPKRLLVNHIARVLAEYGMPRKRHFFSEGCSVFSRLCHTYEHYLIWAVVLTVEKWYKENKHPGADTVLMVWKADHKCMVSDVRRMFCTLTGRNVDKIKCDDSDIIDILVSVRRGKGKKKNAYGEYAEQVIRPLLDLDQ